MKTLSDDGVIKVTAEDITTQTAEEAGRLAASLTNGALPYGYHDTDALTAWTGLISAAVAYGDIAIGVRVNGGGLVGGIVARAGAGKTFVVEACGSGWDQTATDALMALAREQAAAKGGKLVKRVLIPARVEYEAA